MLSAKHSSFKMLKKDEKKAEVFTVVLRRQ